MLIKIIVMYIAAHTCNCVLLLTCTVCLVFASLCHSCKPKLSYHLLSSYHSSTTGPSVPHRLYPSFHRDTRSCGKHAVSFTTASCAEELHPKADGSQQACVYQFCTLSSVIFFTNECLPACLVPALMYSIVLLLCCFM